MTIAVGVKYPWGDLSRLPPPNSKIPEAVILASDSRFSKKQPDGYVPVLDIGTKLFQLGRDAAAVYAGISKVGEECFGELRWQLSQQNVLKSTHSKEIAQKTFRTVYKHQLALMKLEPGDAPLYILIGACNKRGQAELCSFNYATDFNPEPLAIPKALGWPDTVDRFKKLLREELNKNVEEQLSLRHRYPQVPMASWVPMPIKAEEVAILIISILSRIIESGSDKTIGGKLQCALINAEGVSLPEISYSPDPTNEGPGWTRATVNPHGLTTVTGISGIFGSYDLDG